MHHDGELQTYRLARLHEHRVTVCSVKVSLVAHSRPRAASWWSAAVDILSTARANWQQHTVAALTDIEALSRSADLIEPSQQAKILTHGGVLHEEPHTAGPSTTRLEYLR
jgi:hypothetical protein